MKSRSIKSVSLSGAVVASAILWAGNALSAAAQPNFEGVWKIAAPQTVLKPVSGEVPFTAEGRQHYEKNKELRAKGDYNDYDITLARCSSPGVPRLALNPERFKIWNRQKMVTFDYEWNHALRQINLGVPKQPDMMGLDLVPTMAGTSNGHWEGNTLVAVTDNLSDHTLIDDLVPHTLDMKVTEHFRLIDHNTLEDRITIEDPEYFTKPWDAVVRYKRQPDAIFPEDMCLDRIVAHQPAFPTR